VSGLRVLPGFEIASVSLLFDPLRVTNLDNGDVSFTSDSITLRIGELGIAETSANVGLVTANVTFRATQDPPDPPTDVPEPGTFALLGSGVAAAWYRRRRAAGRIVSAS
jgi:hypothetical protein